MYKYGIISNNNGGSHNVKAKTIPNLIFNFSGKTEYFANIVVKINKYPKHWNPNNISIFVKKNTDKLINMGKLKIVE